MSDYTPPVGDIALGYTERAERVCGTNHFAAMDEFDRWLAAHDAEVQAQALAAAADHTYDPGNAQWLRNRAAATRRAAAIREGAGQ